MTPDTFESRLADGLKGMATALAPDVPHAADGNALSGSSTSAGTPATNNGSGSLGSRQSPWLRRIPSRRTGLAAVAAIIVAGGGAGIAAAAGAFQRTRPPAIAWGAERGLITPSDNYTAPGEATRYIGAGPDGMRLTVVSASSHPNSGCIKLEITDPTTSTGVNIPGGCIDVGNAKVSQPTTNAPSNSDYSSSEARWTSPSGMNYKIFFGLGPDKATSLAVVQSIGGNSGEPTNYRQIGGRLQTQNGWFAVAVPSVGRYSVALYNTTGQIIGRLGSGAAFGGELRR